MATVAPRIGGMASFPTPRGFVLVSNRDDDGEPRRFASDRDGDVPDGYRNSGTTQNCSGWNAVGTWLSARR